MSDQQWFPLARTYEPITVGSIDGTDVEPHDRAIVRACNAKFRPNLNVAGEPSCSVFVTRLNHATDEKTLDSVFSKFGQIKQVRLIRDIVTGFSKGYAFIEYFDILDADRAYREANRMEIDDREILVDCVFARSMEGWVPRRLGGGLGGKKESGQLRFGCRDRPFRKPIFLTSEKYHDDIGDDGGPYCRWKHSSSQRAEEVNSVTRNPESREVDKSRESREFTDNARRYDDERPRKRRVDNARHAISRTNFSSKREIKTEPSDNSSDDRRRPKTDGSLNYDFDDVKPDTRH